ncbi:receptor-like protein kinase [Pyrus ussuriensis x Pyrus communis]|uniref:Receptor-like protein kinase n=1 Tax=Pyrus ussuriensis x Pyrus communis TaxID=2448454 RepID=A0A5N5H0F1_9ROSA|nr:receptor-like protein kinase [Pyrus ussuriensis x Pyrus communis]
MNIDSQLLQPLFFLLVIFFATAINVVPSKAAADDHGTDCPISRCRGDRLVIKFPFRLKDDPPHCGHPQFEVSCLQNKTMIQLSSSSGLFPIRTIDYKRKQFRVYDANGCLPRRLLNFTISSNSSQLFHISYDYLSYDSLSYDSLPSYCDTLTSALIVNLTLLNCSTDQHLTRNQSLTRTFFTYYFPISCLSVPGHQVLAFPPTASVADLPVTTCSIWRKHQYLPLRSVDANYNGYECELDSFLWLEWEPWYNFPSCQYCGGYCEPNSSNQLGCYFQQKGHASSRTSIILGASVASFALISAVAAAVFFFHVKRSKSVQEKENQLKVERFLKDHKSHVPTRYSYADIKKMTNGFKKKLGEGGFGSVYSGELPINGVPVAVKVLSDSKGNGEDFVNEVGTIGRIHHVNVVRLLGFSAEVGKRALIYELMPNRSLENFITSKDQSNNTLFDWQKLHNIVNGIAKGIEYLHQGCDRMILHFDIKPRNILLDHDFSPKISDFGLAKLCSKEDSIVSMTAARGTVGYIAPEVFNGNFGNVSHKSDVYSFGMLVLEIVGARKVTALASGNSEVYFPELVYKRLVQGEELDLKLDTDEDTRIAKKLVIVALWCIQWHPVNRPPMKAVVRMLEGGSENLSMPPNPFASTSAQTDQPRTTLSS